MYRVIVFYEQEPDAEAYAAHAEVCRRVPNAVFRHGKVLGSPMGEAKHTYFAEWEFADKDAFDNGTKSDEFMASGKDARDRGLPRPFAEFLELN
jgi:hypothetical protein